MSTELFELTLAFRGLSDEDEEDTGVDSPGAVDGDEDDDLDDVSAPATGAGADDDEETGGLAE